MSSWFARPETVTLPLSDGQFLVVRKRLSAGERRAARKRMADPVDGSFVLATAYLLDWSLAEYPIRGVSVDDLMTALDNLDADRFLEIAAAINAHVDAMHAEREEEKKLQAPTRGDGAISPSPFVAGGGSNGSGNLTKTTTTFS